MDKIILTLSRLYKNITPTSLSIFNKNILRVFFKQVYALKTLKEYYQKIIFMYIDNKDFIDRNIMTYKIWMGTIREKDIYIYGKLSDVRDCDNMIQIWFKPYLDDFILDIRSVIYDINVLYDKIQNHVEKLHILMYVLIHAVYDFDRQKTRELMNTYGRMLDIDILDMIQKKFKGLIGFYNDNKVSLTTYILNGIIVYDGDIHYNLDIKPYIINLSDEHFYNLLEEIFKFLTVYCEYLSVSDMYKVNKALKTLTLKEYIEKLKDTTPRLYTILQTYIKKYMIDINTLPSEKLKNSTIFKNIYKKYIVNIYEFFDTSRFKSSIVELADLISQYVSEGVGKEKISKNLVNTYTTCILSEIGIKISQSVLTKSLITNIINAMLMNYLLDFEKKYVYGIETPFMQFSDFIIPTELNTIIINIHKTITLYYTLNNYLVDNPVIINNTKIAGIDALLYPPYNLNLSGIIDYDRVLKQILDIMTSKMISPDIDIYNGIESFIISCTRLYITKLYYTKIFKKVISGKLTEYLLEIFTKIIKQNDKNFGIIHKKEKEYFIIRANTKYINEEMINQIVDKILIFLSDICKLYQINECFDEDDLLFKKHVLIRMFTTNLKHFIY